MGDRQLARDDDRTLLYGHGHDVAPRLQEALCEK